MEYFLSSAKFILPNKRARRNLEFALLFAENCSNDTASLMRDPVDARCPLGFLSDAGLFPAASRRKVYKTGGRYIFHRSWLHRRSRDKSEKIYICARGRRKDNSPSLARSLSPSNSRKIDRFRRSYNTIPRIHGRSLTSCLLMRNW